MNITLVNITHPAPVKPDKCEFAFEEMKNTICRCSPSADANLCVKQRVIPVCVCV